MNFNLNPKTILARLSVIVFLMILIWGCGRVPRLSDSAPPSSRLPFVKVLLDDTSRDHLISSLNRGQIAIDCYKSGKRVSYYSRQPVIVQGKGNQLVLLDYSGNRLDGKIERMTISPRGKGQSLKNDSKSYRGMFELLSSSGQIQLVNIVYVEDYLKGVVPLEIGPIPEKQTEAGKAQAVAARTYAMSHLGQYGDVGYDLKSSIADQVYGGIQAENNLINKAIMDTRGLVAVYNGQMISAYYHSTCGGKTDDVEDVWNKEAKPYLVMVNDGNACEASKYFTWEESFTAEQILLRLQQYLSRERGRSFGNLGQLKDVRINGRTPGGRVASITFETINGRYSFDKEKVRWVIGRSNNPDLILRSARFSLVLERDAQGYVTKITFDGSGYGHGVGMCQMGARGLASKGISFDSIIKTYYQKTDIKKLY